MRISTKWSIAVLTFLAGLKVFLFSAALPFLAATDEQSHFDNIYRYARGDVPRKLVPISEGCARQMILFGSFEIFLAPPPGPPSWYRTPFWTDNLATSDPAFHQGVMNLTRATNIEAVQPPPYYVLAAAWYRLGVNLGLRGGWLMYWLRFLNVPLFALLVPVAYLLARSCYGNETWIPMGAAVFTAVIPQDIFYSMNNDCLVPLLSGLALWAVVCLTKMARPHWRVCLGAGLLVGVALFNKLSNLPLLLAVGILLVAGLRGTWKGHKNLLPVAGFLVLSVLPMGLWLLWNHHNTGDWTNSTEKVAHLTWTRKPWSEILDHPVFHGRGLGKFYWLTIANFWSGEGVWHRDRISLPWLDAIYVLTTTGCSIAVIVALIKRRLGSAGVYDIAFLTYFVVSLGSLLILSLLWDFGSCFYPSRLEPFFFSGRLILGCLLPLVLVCLRGLELMLRPLCPGQRNVIFGGMVAAILVLQTVPRIEQFRSAFNWYHLKVPQDPAIMKSPF